MYNNYVCDGQFSHTLLLNSSYLHLRAFKLGTQLCMHSLNYHIFLLYKILSVI